MNNATIECLNSDTQAEILGYMLPAQLANMAVSSRVLNDLINRSDHSGAIWRQAFRNLLGRGDTSASDLGKIARSSYSNENILREVIGHLNADDSVLREVASSQNVNAQILATIRRINDLRDQLPADLKNVSQTDKELSEFINRSKEAGYIWRQAFRNLLGRGDASASDLSNIARSAFVNESILREVLEQRNVDDSVLEEVAGNQNVSVGLLSDIVGHGRIGVGTGGSSGLAYNYNHSGPHPFWSHQSIALSAVARSELATENILLRIVRHSLAGGSHGARMVAAENSNATVNVLRAILENVESEDSTLSAVTNNPHVTHEMLYEILENPAAFAFRDEVQAKIRSMRGQHHMQDTAASAARRRLIGEHQTTFRAPQLLPPSARRRQLADRGALRRSTEATSATRREHEASSSHQPPAAEAYETLAGSRGRGSNVYRSASNSRRTNLSSDRPAPSTSLGNHFGGTESGHRPTPSQRALGRLGGGEKGEDTQRGNSHRRKR